MSNFYPCPIFPGSVTAIPIKSSAQAWNLIAIGLSIHSFITTFSQQDL